jgi:hypothetical protein
MSKHGGDILAEKLTAARVFIRRDGSDDVILRVTGAIDGDRSYIVSRSEFLRLVRSLGHDAAKLSAMSTTAGAMPS